MGTGQKISSKPLDYGPGALAVLVISVGLAAIVYALAIIPFNVINLLTWIFGPLGAFTIAYSFLSKDITYYLVWGCVLFAVAVASALYNVVNVFVVLGMLIIVIAVIGIVGYWRSRR